MPRTHGLSHATWARTLDVHDAALARGTTTNYEAGLRHFEAWCRSERVPFSREVAVSEPIACAYAASQAGWCAGGTARSRLAALKFWHERQGLPWVSSARLTRILKSVQLAAPPSSRKDARPPVTEAMLDEALHALDPVRPFDVCVAAAMLTMFWCQLRGGEIVSNSRTYDFTALPSVKCLRLRHDAGGDASRMTSALWLPRTKTDREGVWIWIAKHWNDPSHAIRDHIARSKLRPDDPLFAYRHDTSNMLVALTKAAFIGRLNEIWEPLRIPRITIHSFRIGGTTALLRAGVDPEVVKVAGRWKSDSFLRYWRALDNIVSSHMDLCDVYWQADRNRAPVF
ncbi:DNA breaking-rejoining enzyme [Exidia glandulosa HHB12029]|uniref:DNA breaking-rejoining enzyme n=1 Tax=Exidia glandulosa HHB12029 TaxID=1314781 RepID=A0A165NP70_EXIGL|nr:DNA breaking-rejoining enzyme [Exidia glandulosa HHB12029]